MNGDAIELFGGRPGWRTHPVYCLFCETGREATVENFLRGDGCHRKGIVVMGSVAMRTVYRRGRGYINLPRPVLPGYVFFTCPAALDDADWLELRRGCKYIYRPLRYGDGATALRSADLALVRWLWRHDGVIGVSKVARVGSRIKVLEGPLAEYEGCITRVHKRQRYVEVAVESEGVTHTAILSVEFVDVES